MCIGCALEIYIWLSNKVVCNIHIGDTLNYLNSRCNTAKLLWVVIYVVCYGRFSPHLVVMNICRQRLIKVKSPLWQRSLANENAVVCRQGAMRWRLLSIAIRALSTATSHLSTATSHLLTAIRALSTATSYLLTVVRHLPMIKRPCTVHWTPKYHKAFINCCKTFAAC